MFWKKILFIFNPVAGMSRIRDSLLDIISILSSHGYSVECYPTKAPGDARRIVRECKNEYLYICCAGGDGTLDEVVSGMMENRELPFLPIGYIPSGTTNDFAGTLGIPSDMKEAAEVIASGKVFNCDIGRFNQEDYFTYVAGFGLFTETSYDTPQELKNTLGHFAYIIRGAMSLGNIRTYKAIVQAKNINIRDEFAVGLITNSKSVGGFANITGNNVDLSDGLFEVTLIKMPRNPIEINEIFQALSNNTMESSLIYHFKTDHLTIMSEDPISWTRDGEFGGEHNYVELTNIRQKLKIIVPQSHLGSLQIVR